MVGPVCIDKELTHNLAVGTLFVLFRFVRRYILAKKKKKLRS
jgi:hypothetical protein